MLNVRKAPRTCLVYRPQQLSRRNIFVTWVPTNSSRYQSTNIARKINRIKPPCSNSHPKPFSSTSAKSEGEKKNTPINEIPPGDQTDTKDQRGSGGVETEIESVVRQARQSFGDNLPKDFLTDEEYKLYERLYGAPLRETTGEDLEFIPTDEETPLERPRNPLFRMNSNMELEEVEYEPTAEISIVNEHPKTAPTANDKQSEIEQDLARNTLGEGINESNSAQASNIDSNFQYIARNQRERDAMERLRKDMNIAAEQRVEEEHIEPEEYVEEEEYPEEEEEEEDDLFTSSDAARTHPHTMTGRSRTNPSTLSLPIKAFSAPITEMLSRTKPIHLQMAAEKALGGKGLPFSSSVHSSMKDKPQKEIGLSASQYKMSEIEADAYISAVMPGVYVSIMNTLIEVRKRLGHNWLRDLMFRGDGEGPRVLDAGSGGAGIIAWKSIMKAEWDAMKEDGIVEGDFSPLGTSSVVVGSDCLRHRASKLLENTTFLPRLPDYIHATNINTQNDAQNDTRPVGGRKIYDIIIAPHTLLPQKENYRRRDMIKNLWTLVNPNGGILIIIEKGIPRGFEAVASARSLILDQIIASPGSRFVENDSSSPKPDMKELVEKEEGMIIAPCTNHAICPMYPHPGLSNGRKDYCHFAQRFIRPAFLQRLLGAKSRNHEDVKFSYVAFQRGIDARKSAETVLSGDEATTQAFKGYEEHDLPESHQGEDYAKSNVIFNTLSLPRVVLPPLKRHGHVTLDLCTPSGKLERWTVPKSFSKVAYRDARKSKWGDLWALGAKTRVQRNVRLGKVTHAPEATFKGAWEGKVTKSAKKVQKYDAILGDGGFEGFRKAGKYFEDRNEKRTKGGRLSKGPRPIGVDDL